MNGRFWRSTRTTPLLWEFLLSLLQDSECNSIIQWLDESAMTFKIVNSYQVATLWGEIKGRPCMDQNKLRRAIRQYYKSGIMKKVKGQKGGYKFEKLPYNPFKHHQQQQPNDDNSSPVKQNETLMLREENDQLDTNNNCFYDNALIVGENVTMSSYLSDQYMDCESPRSDTSVESWLRQYKHLNLGYCGNAMDQSYILDNLSDAILLDYLI